MLLVAWCCACITAPLLLATAIPWPAWLESVVAVVAGCGGLAFALWSVARLTGQRV
jgi:hypothetical protein